MACSVSGRSDIRQGHSRRDSSILLRMKSQVAVSLVLVGLLTASLAAAQNQSGPAAAQKKESQKDPLFFVKIATDIAGNVRPGSLNGFLALYIDQQSWASGLKDGDLGPFLKVKEAKPGRSAACLFSNAKDVAICVYFDGDTPFGVTAVKAGASGKIEAADVPGAYKAVTKEMLEKGGQELHFERGDAATDDGQALPAYMVTTGPKFPS